MSSSLPILGTLKDAARGAWPERRLQKFRVHERGLGESRPRGGREHNFPLSAPTRGRGRFGFRGARSGASGWPSLRSDSDPGSGRHPSRPAGWPFIAYPKLPGLPLSSSGPVDSLGWRRLNEFVDTLLQELAAIPPRSLLRIGAAPGSPSAWGDRFRRLQRRFAGHGASMTPPSLRRAIAQQFERFYLDLHGAHYRAVPTHRDLGPDHILWDPVTSRPTGVLDWEDLCLGDPAFDLTGLRTVGRSGFARWARKRRAGADISFDARLGFYTENRPHPWRHPRCRNTRLPVASGLLAPPRDGSPGSKPHLGPDRQGDPLVPPLGSITVVIGRQASAGGLPLGLDRSSPHCNPDPVWVQHMCTPSLGCGWGPSCSSGAVRQKPTMDFLQGGTTRYTNREVKVIQCSSRNDMGRKRATPEGYSLSSIIRRDRGSRSSPHNPPPQTRVSPF